MADPHIILAPLVEPPLPPVPVAAPSMVPPLPMVAALAVAIILATLLFWGWRHRAPQRALRRIARLPDPVQAAHQLAQWQPRHRRLAPSDWLQALEQLRFGPPAAEQPATLARLCAAAQTFTRAP